MNSNNRNHPSRESKSYSRRKALQLLGVAGMGSAIVGGGLGGVVFSGRHPRIKQVKTTANIVIAGAGAAGLALASRLSRQLTGAKITLIDGRKAHYYQPGFTLVGAGVKPQNYPISTTAEYIPQNVEWIEDWVAEFDPEANKVTTESGKSYSYDYLFVTTGMVLDYDAIEGMDTALIGTNGLGSIYHGAESAYKTYQLLSEFADQGGIGLFHRPNTEMKCAGAPLKYTFIAEDYLARRNNRGRAKIIYNSNNRSFFSVPIVSEKVRMLFRDRQIETNYDHVMRAIDPSKKIATFVTPDGDKEYPYDFINVIPPMRAPTVIQNSPLPWQEGAWGKEGWLDVDRGTLRHKRYPNIFGIGDIAGVPKGKTAASIKWQVPIAIDHLLASITDKESDLIYTGYTSCPLITRLGRAMLIEFDYENNLMPSFPGVIAPLEELWVSWVMKTMALKPTYISMLRGFT